MKESTSDVIDLYNTSPEAFQVVLEYMYSGMVGTVNLQVNTGYMCLALIGSLQVHSHIGTCCSPVLP